MICWRPQARRRPRRGSRAQRRRRARRPASGPDRSRRRASARPSAAQRRAVAAATDVLPTPPLPVYRIVRQGIERRECTLGPHVPLAHAPARPARAAALGLVACGGDDSRTTTPTAILAETFGEGKDVKSGRLDVSLRLNAKGLEQLQGPVGAARSAARSSRRGRPSCRASTSRPRVDASGQQLKAGAVSTGEKGFLQASRTRPTTVGDELYKQFKDGYAEQAKCNEERGRQAAAASRALGVDPRQLAHRRRERRARRRSAAPRRRTSPARVDVPEVPRGRQPHPRRAPNRAAGRPVRRREGQRPAQAARARRQLTEERPQADRRRDQGRARRRLDRRGGPDPAPHERRRCSSTCPRPSAEGRRPESGDLRFDMTIGALNEEQTIKAPAERQAARRAHRRARRRRCRPRPGAGGGAAQPEQRRRRRRQRAAPSGVEVPAVPRRRRPGRREAPGVRGAHRPVTLSHVAIGTWSGGRFMHFGQPLDDERLVALLRPDDAIRDGRHRRRLRRGRGRPRPRPRARGPRPRRATSSSARSATTSTRASARARRASRASPTRACAGRTSYADVPAHGGRAQPRAPRRRRASTCCCCTTPTARATRARRCGRGWPRCATPA